MDPKQTQLGGSTMGHGTMGGHDGRSADQIARDIAARRAEMNALADTLEERLAPKQLASEVSHAVKKQLQGRTHRAASAMAHSVRQDPFPWLLMGLGAAWLIKERRERTSPQRFGAVKRGAGHSDVLGVSSYGTMGYGTTGHGTMGYASESPGAPVSGLSDTGVMGQPESGIAEKAHAAREKVAEKTHEVREKVADKAHVAKERVAETAHDVRERVSSKMSSARESAHLARLRATEKGRQARVQLSRQYDSSPLLLGLAALVGGVALGAALPSTRKEGEVMGPMRDRLLEQARESGRDMAGKVSRVAEVAVHTAVDQLDRESATEDLGRIASSTAQAAKEAAHQEAQRQGLASSGDGTERTSGGANGGGRAAGGGRMDGLSGGSQSRSGGLSDLGGLSGGLPSSSSVGSTGGVRASGAGGGSAMAPSSGSLSGGATVSGGSGGGPLVPPGSERDPRES